MDRSACVDTGGQRRICGTPLAQSGCQRVGCGRTHPARPLRRQLGVIVLRMCESSYVGPGRARVCASTAVTRRRRMLLRLLRRNQKWEQLWCGMGVSGCVPQRAIASLQARWGPGCGVTGRHRNSAGCRRWLGAGQQAVRRPVGGVQGPGSHRYLSGVGRPSAAFRDALPGGCPCPPARPTEALVLVALNACRQNPAVPGGDTAHHGHQFVEPCSGSRPNQHKTHASSKGCAGDRAFPPVLA